MLTSSTQPAAHSKTSENLPQDSSAAGFSLEAYKIAQCKKRKIVLYCPVCEKNYAIVYKCRSRLCPNCSRERSLMWFHRLKHLKFQYPIHLVLTLKVTQDLGAALNLILNSFRKFRRRLKLSRGVYSIEINKSARGGWFVHLHSLINCIWLDGEKVSRIWRQYTGSYVKSIKRVRDREKGVLEICKYISKGLAEFDSEDLGEVARAIGSRRLINCWGLSKFYSLLDTQETSHQKWYCPDCGSVLFYKETIDNQEYLNRFFDGSIKMYDPEWAAIGLAARQGLN